MNTIILLLCYCVMAFGKAYTSRANVRTALRLYTHNAIRSRSRLCGVRTPVKQNSQVIVDTYAFPNPLPRTTRFLSSVYFVANSRTREKKCIQSGVDDDGGGGCRSFYLCSVYIVLYNVCFQIIDPSQRVCSCTRRDAVY